jgi:uncharacterized protein YndB with AHSA1/START domain
MFPFKPRTIRKEVFYPYPPERVWVALTDPHALAEWLMPNTFKPIKGQEFQFRNDPQWPCGDAFTKCRVLEIDPPRRMVWSWLNRANDPAVPDAPPSRVTWILTPERGGTRLSLEHSGLDHERWIIATLMNTGWGIMMSRLIPKVLLNAAPDPPHGYSPGAIPIEKRGYKCRTVPAEYVR